MTHTVESLMALAYKVRDARTYEWDVSDVVAANEALRAALTEALAPQATQLVREQVKFNWSELVAWWESGGEQFDVLKDIVQRMAKAAQPVREPLTIKQHMQIWDAQRKYHGGEPLLTSHLEYGKAIELSHGIGVSK
jgi:hypothetical protein